MSVTIPAKLHLIVSGEVGIYFTVWIGNRRYHWGRRSKLIGHESGAWF